MHRLLGVYVQLKIIGATNGNSHQKDPLERARRLITDICNDHVFAAESFVKDPGRRAELTDKIRAECQELVEYIAAAKRFNLEINARSKDRVISFGEKLSCLFMTALLQDAVRTCRCLTLLLRRER